MSSRPEIGELWLISWDGEAVALGVITRVAPSFVTCWPVTFVDTPVFAPALVVEDSPLALPVLVWPTRETGVGMHMLHRKLGQILSRTTVSLIDAAFDDDGDRNESPLPIAARTVEGDEAEFVSDLMVDLWQGICLNIWPTAVPGDVPLSPDALRQAGMQVSDLADALAVPLPTAFSLLRGEHAPTAEQLDRLAELLGVDPQSLLENGEDAHIETLVRPELKDRYLTLAQVRGISEMTARNLVASEFALAARSDGDPLGYAEAVIDRLAQR